MPETDKTSVMNIGLDGRALEGNPAGIGRYVYELCVELESIMSGVRFYVYSRHPVAKPSGSTRWNYRVDGSKVAQFMTGYMWLKTRCGSMAKKDKLDVFWSPSTLLPKVGTETVTVSTVHDINYLLVPETMAAVNLWAHRLWFRSDVLKADLVTTNSNATAERFMQRFGRKADAVITPGVSDHFCRRPRGEVDQCLDRYGVKGPYLLSVATREPRKNLDLLVEAFLGLKRSGALCHHSLVLVGGKGWGRRRLKSSLELGSTEGIAQLGYIESADLPCLYSGTDAFVFPSIYEGFGIPVAEAVACGARVVATDTPELREAGAGGDVKYVEATVEALSKGILSALSAPPEKAFTEARFAWRESARTLQALILSRAR